MSTEASISIKLVELTYKNENFSSIKIINLLLNFGWTFNDYGKVSYLPIGDNDNFDWKREEISIETLMHIITTKINNNEEIVVVMTWQNTNIGGIFAFRKNDSISINLIMNRKILADYGNFKITDVNWYLEKLLPALNNNNLYVTSYTYEEDR